MRYRRRPAPPATTRPAAFSDLIAIIAARSDGAAHLVDLAVHDLDETTLSLAAFRAVELLLLLCALVGDVGTGDVLQRLALVVAAAETAAA